MGLGITVRVPEEPQQIINKRDVGAGQMHKVSRASGIQVDTLASRARANERCAYSNDASW